MSDIFSELLNIANEANKIKVASAIDIFKYNINCASNKQILEILQRIGKLIGMNKGSDCKYFTNEYKKIFDEMQIIRTTEKNTIQIDFTPKSKNKILYSFYF